MRGWEVRRLGGWPIGGWEVRRLGGFLFPIKSVPIFKFQLVHLTLFAPSFPPTNPLPSSSRRKRACLTPHPVCERKLPSFKLSH